MRSILFTGVICTSRCAICSTCQIYSFGRKLIFSGFGNLETAFWYSGTPKLQNCGTTAKSRMYNGEVYDGVLQADVVFILTDIEPHLRIFGTENMKRMKR